DDHPVAYVPSAAVLGRLTEMRPRGGPAIVVGDATGDLPDARREAGEVAKLLAVEPRVGSDATRARILDATGASVLHVATPTTAPAVGPALVLADGRLGVGEVIDRGIAPDLVVLASCGSADAHDHAELGALASAFFAAGTRTVVASKWTVADRVAHDFSA